MAQVFGSAGNSAFAMGDTRQKDLISRIVLPMLSFLMLIPVGYYLFTRGHFVWAALVAITYVFCIKSLEEIGLKLKKRISDADTGAKSEQTVAEALHELPDDYYVFHDLEFPGFNIDHVVLGPNGIFLVETKSQQGNITQEKDVLLRNGRKLFKDFLKQCWSQTYSLRDHLGADKLRGSSIEPILCFARGFVEIRGPVRGVAVLNVSYLRPYILSQRGTVPDQTIRQCITALAAAVSNKEANPSSPVHQTPIGRVVCPKCLHERTKVDDLYFSASECPKCGVIYTLAQADTTDKSPNAGTSSSQDMFTTVMSLLSFLPKRFRFTPLTGLTLPQSKPGSTKFSWNILALKLAACALSALLLIGAFKTIRATVTSIFQLSMITKATSGSSLSNPEMQVKLAPTHQVALSDFPLTHAVAAKDVQNAIPFVFQEDRGQNVILILFNPQSKKLILRACVRSGEKLTSMLPQGEMAFFMVTGSSWGGFDELFGKNTDTRKARTVLSSSPKQGTVPKFLTSTSLLFQHGAPSSLSETKALVDFAFKRSNNL